MQSLIMQILPQQTQQISNPQYKPIIIDKHIGRHLPIQLLLTSAHMLNIIDRQCRHKDEEIIKMLIIFTS